MASHHTGPNGSQVTLILKIKLAKFIFSACSEHFNVYCRMFYDYH
jgi:hypothetical protein